MLGRLAVLLVTAALSLQFCSAQSTREEFAALAASQGGTIKLDSKTYDAITNTNRDWSVAVELTATTGTQVSCAPCIEFAPNFDGVAKAWRKVPKAQRDYHFFARLEFKDGTDVFRRLGLNSAPFVIFYPAQKGPLLESKPNKNQWTYDFNAHGLDAKTFAEQVSNGTPVPVPYTPPLNYALIGAAVGTVIGLFAAYKIFGNIILAFITSRWIWGIFSLAFIITMLAGQMFVRIRHSPYGGNGRDSNGQPVVSHIAGGYQNQYGAEVQIIGGLYSLLAASQIALVVFVPQLPSAARQRSAVYIWLAVTWMLFSVLVAIFKQKHAGYPFKLFLG